MRYTVVWERSALGELANLWMAADSVVRAQISAATAELDRTLAIQPEIQGESRANGRRIVIAAPLVATFMILPPDRQVKVLAVHLMPSQDS